MIDAAALAAAMFVRLIALPFLGIDLTNLVANGIHGSEVGGGLIWRLAAIAPIALFFGLIVVAAQRRDGAVWLALSAISIAGVTFGFGMVIVNPVDVFNVAQGQRYNFLPLVLLGLALVALWTRSGARGRPLWALLCALVLLNGAIAYLKPAHQFAEGPSWPAEVRAWRSNHDRQLAVWPRPWAADLSDHSHPCLPTSGDLARPVNPSYCESGWIEGFHRRQ